MPPCTASVPQNIAVPAGSSCAAGIEPDQFLGRTHRRDRALLIEAPLARAGHERAQDQPVPMRRDVAEPPKKRAHGLRAHLLRQRDADRLRLAVGVIGAEPEPQAIGERIDHHLRLAARVAADHLDRVRGGEQRRGDAIEDRRRLRPRNAERFELTNMRLERGLIASRPSRDDEMPYVAQVERAFFSH